MKIIAIDIGGSSIKSCLAKSVEDCVELILPVKTSPLLTKQISEIKEIIINLCKEYLKAGADPIIGISTAGSVDPNQVVIKAGNFVDYVNTDWAEILKKEFPEASITTANDGRSSAWGEYLSQEIKPTTHIHAVIGTGVGGGIVHKGELLLGESGQAGYIGHIKVLTSSNRVCGCGSTGCVETLASARAVVLAYYEISEGEGLPEGLDFRQLINSFDKDPDNITKALEQSGYWLGIALGNIMDALNPKQITLGGGAMVATESLIKDGHIDYNPYLRGVNRGIAYAAHSRVCAACDVKIGVLGNNAGLIGVSNLALAGES